MVSKEEQLQKTNNLCFKNTLNYLNELDLPYRIIAHALIAG
jgi:hypothetical protein